MYCKKVDFTTVEHFSEWFFFDSEVFLNLLHGELFWRFHSSGIWCSVILRKWNHQLHHWQKPQNPYEWFCSICYVWMSV